ncbi:MAG: DUF2059 domain-containing protein [Gammaproteobacteria bacterium]|nr:MAG: DUF2059 domain-containing protein [Gammaproteobacteria bacterium]
MKKLIVAIIISALPFAALANEKTKRETVDKLLAAMNVESMMDSMYSQIENQINSMAQSMGIKKSEMAVFQRYQTKMFALMKKEMTWQKMKDPMIDLYMKHFTEKELQDTLVYYQSESGQSMMRKMPAIMKDSMEISMGMVKEFLPKMQKLNQEMANDLEKMRNK